MLSSSMHVSSVSSSCVTASEYTLYICREVKAVQRAELNCEVSRVKVEVC